GTALAVGHTFFLHKAVGIAQRAFPDLYASSPRAFTAVTTLYNRIAGQFDFQNLAFILLLTLLCISFTWVYAFASGKLSRRTFTAGIIALLMLDLATWQKHIVFVPREALADAPASARFIQDHGNSEPFRIFGFRPGNAFYSR